MIAALFWLAQIVAVPVAPSSAPANVQLTPSIVLQRYAVALGKVKEPQVISFDYTIEQTGPRALAQTHRVFRSASDERDETLTVDGKRLSPPKVRIFRGRRNRYTLGLLAPREADYAFAYVGSRKDGHHVDYVFRLTPKGIRPFTVTDVIIDGVRFLPLAIGFLTGANEGAGSIAFGSNARWWVPYVAIASATVAATRATEKLTFYTYRFPQTLPFSTFSQARRSASPATTSRTAPARPAPLLPPARPGPLLPPARPAPLLPPARPAPLLPPGRPAPLLAPARQMPLLLAPARRPASVASPEL